MKKSEKGLSLIEASMVLALSAIVVSGVMFYYQSASDSNKNQNTISEVMSTVAAINGLYVGQSSFNGLDNKVLWSSSAIPSSYKSSDSGVINNPFGGQLDIETDDKAKVYAITLTGLPQSACLNLASMNLGTSAVGVGANFSDINTAITAADTPSQLTIGDSSATPNKLYSSLPPVGASAVCNKESDNSVSFIMR